jgi:hypothetical protein
MWMSMFVGCSKETWWKNAHTGKAVTYVCTYISCCVLLVRPFGLETSDDQQQILVQLGLCSVRLSAKLSWNVAIDQRSNRELQKLGT